MTNAKLDLQGARPAAGLTGLGLPRQQLELLNSAWMAEKNAGLNPGPFDDTWIAAHTAMVPPAAQTAPQPAGKLNGHADGGAPKWRLWKRRSLWWTRRRRWTS